VKTRLVLTLVFMAVVSLSGCDMPEKTRAQVSKESTIAAAKTSLLSEKNNVVAGVTASFYGVQLDPSLKPSRVIEYVTFTSKVGGESVKYTTASDTKQAADFYSVDIWSPDSAYLLLPIGKKEGFAMFNAKTAILDIKASKYADTLVVAKKTELSKEQAKEFGTNAVVRNYWHTFLAWEGPSSFRFKADMERDTVEFVYDIPTRQLSCFDPGCATSDTARNLAGKIMAQEKVK
jgi:hypothetical protein